MKAVMGFMQPFFSGSSAALECVASSNFVVGSQQVLGSPAGMEPVRAVQTPEGTECPLLDVHPQLGRRPVLEQEVLSRVHTRGTQPSCRFSWVSFCQALATDDSAQALVGMLERGVPL